jgi:hypothetical protein
MASIRKEIALDAPADQVWDAIRDFGAVHQRVAPGFVVDLKLDGDARVVTFHNGTVAREVPVDIDDELRRLVYAIVEGRLSAHSASVQVFAEDACRSRIVWIADFLPNELAGYIRSQMDIAAVTMKQTLERQPAAQSSRRQPRPGAASRWQA